MISHINTSAGSLMYQSIKIILIKILLQDLETEKDIEILIIYPYQLSHRYRLKLYSTR